MSDTDNQYSEITSSEKIKENNEENLNNLTNNKGEIQYSLTTNAGIIVKSIFATFMKPLNRFIKY